MNYGELSGEQKRFIDTALTGQNILVDACIGSGKTTAIQTFCCQIGMNQKRILYLTYNTLLKLDAKKRISSPNVVVTNYHGFCYGQLRSQFVFCGTGDLIQTYNRIQPDVPHYDVLILDEYQDIDQEISEMLYHIKDQNPGMQLIAVGDMEQKIYDKTRLDVRTFISDFLDTYVPMEFTQCFRLGANLASMLGRIWGKNIIGVNPDFELLYMTEKELYGYIPQFEPGQLLVLGSNRGARNKLQNFLEKHYPEKFHKYTVWSKISEKDSGVQPTADCAIFTTYDGCKGMERDVCVLYDWSIDYWLMRLRMPEAKYEIIRNIFCVATSRGKRKVIFVRTKQPLDEMHLSTVISSQYRFTDMAVSEMFDFKFIEDVESAYQELTIEQLSPCGTVIDVPMSLGMIDLSFCVGTYLEAMYFSNYNIDRDIEYQLGRVNKKFMRMDYSSWTLDQKILYLAMLETMQHRYWNQVPWPVVSDEQRKAMRDRLSLMLPEDAKSQVSCSIMVSDRMNQAFVIDGMADVIHDSVVYELKFVSELSHTHFLQTAMYMAARFLSQGVLWNVRTGEMYSIRIRDRQSFLDKAVYAATKGCVQTYYGDSKLLCKEFIGLHTAACQEFLKETKKKKRCLAKWVNGFFEDRGLQLPVPANVFVKCLRSK